MKKTILITGSTDGIGKIVATKLAKEGHTIYVHGRNPLKLATVVSEIKALSNNQYIHELVADFSDLNDVKKMCDHLKKEIPALDILINNAGVFKSRESRNQDNLDLRFVVNYLAPFLITHELLPLLESADSPRIINLSSAAQAPVNIKALVGDEELSTNESYAQSKLALTMWSFYLAKKYEHVKVIAVNPGSLLNTKMVSEAYGQHWAPADKGGAILYELAISDEYRHDTGKYFDNDKGADKGHFSNAHPDAYDQEKIDQLVVATKSLLSLN